MTLKEATMLVAWATANFPSLQERDMRPTAQLWQRMLDDLPYDVVEKALAKVMTGAKYFPTVAEIREAALSLATSALPTSGEAWGEVLQAVREYGFYRPDEALESLSPAVRRAVECIGWPEICLEDEVAVRAHFLRTYESLAKREQEMALLTPEIRGMIGAITQRKELPEPDKDRGPARLTMQDFGLRKEA